MVPFDIDIDVGKGIDIVVVDMVVVSIEHARHAHAQFIGVVEQSFNGTLTYWRKSDNISWTHQTIRVR